MTRKTWVELCNLHDELEVAITMYPPVDIDVLTLVHKMWRLLGRDKLELPEVTCRDCGQPLSVNNGCRGVNHYHNRQD